MSTLSDLAATLTQAAPYAGAIEAAANFGIDVTKLFTPDLTQKYDDQTKARIGELVSILESPGSDQPARLGAFFQQLCIDGESPAVGLGDDISIPVVYLLALATISCKFVALNSMFNELVLAGKQPAAAAPAAK